MMKRLFAAIKINPDPHFLNIYYALKSDLRHEKIKWVDPKNLHLTLKFFGETPESKIESINNVLAQIASSTEPIEISIVKTGIFGSAYKPRVIWAGFDNEAILKELGNQLIDALDKNDFPADRQNFVPHLTLGRIKHIENKKLFQLVIDKVKNVHYQHLIIYDFYLFESILKPDGPVYHALNKFPLNSVNS